MILSFGIVLFLLFLFYQDMRFKAIYWVCFPVLFILLLISGLSYAGIDRLLMNGALNTGFLLLQLVILSIYFSVKLHKAVNITEKHLGWGDILFLMSVAFYLSPLNYVVFYTLSLIIILSAGLVFQTRSKLQHYKIPLAGLQALIFAGFLITDWNSSSVSLLSDEWLLKFLDV